MKVVEQPWGQPSDGQPSWMQTRFATNSGDGLRVSVLRGIDPRASRQPLFRATGVPLWPKDQVEGDGQAIDFAIERTHVIDESTFGPRVVGVRRLGPDGIRHFRLGVSNVDEQQVQRTHFVRTEPPLAKQGDNSRGRVRSRIAALCLCFSGAVKVLPPLVLMTNAARRPSIGVSRGRVFERNAVYALRHGVPSILMGLVSGSFPVVGDQTVGIASGCNPNQNSMYSARQAKSHVLHSGRYPVVVQLRGLTVLGSSELYQSGSLRASNGYQHLGGSA